MHPAGPYTPTKLPARSDNSGSSGDADLYDQLLAGAQLAANADAAERLDRAYASIEERLARIAATMPQELVLARLEAAAAAADRISASMGSEDTPAVSVSQLRLVVGGP